MNYELCDCEWQLVQVQWNCIDDMQIRKGGTVYVMKGY